VEATLGAIAVMVLKLPVGGVDSSMKLLEMKDWGCVADRLACVGATEDAVPLSAFKLVVTAALTPLLPPTVPRSTVSAKAPSPVKVSKAKDITLLMGFCGKGHLEFM